MHLLDQSADAIAAAKRNAENNGVDKKCSFEVTNVFDWLKAQTTVGPNEKLIPKFDCIILDPPSFTRTRAAVPEALRGYKEIHLRALKLLKPGGTLYLVTKQLDDVEPIVRKEFGEPDLYECRGYVIVCARRR